jgi:hypothetical protein
LLICIALSFFIQESEIRGGSTVRSSRIAGLKAHVKRKPEWPVHKRRRKEQANGDAQNDSRPRSSSLATTDTYCGTRAWRRRDFV